MIKYLKNKTDYYNYKLDLKKLACYIVLFNKNNWPKDTYLHNNNMRHIVV